MHRLPEMVLTTNDEGDTASLSPCGTWRYILTRKISCPLRWVHPLLAILINPSTADAFKPDPTITRLKDFGRRWACSSLTVANLYAYRSKNISDLKTCSDPIGPGNDEVLLDLFDRHRTGIILVGWGATPFAQKRAAEVSKLLEGRDVMCLRTTKSGAPEHPLYIPAETKPIPWPVREAA